MQGRTIGQGCPSHLLEECSKSIQAGRVDRANGIIRDVKIISHNSDNHRKYTDGCLMRAVRLYEGCKVNVDHPKRPEDQRSSYDRIGEIRNVRHTSTGLIGDFHLLLSHPLAAQIMEAAERMPQLYGLSHNADGRVIPGDDGYDVVEEITDVRSCDLVADPATNKSLFESRTVKKTVRQRLQESKKIKDAAKKQLLEMYDESSLAEMDSPMEMGTEVGDFKQDLLAAIGKLVEAEDEDSHKMAKKIFDMFKPAKAAPSAEPEEETETETSEGNDYEPEDDDEDGEYMEESRKLIAKKDEEIKSLTEQLDRAKIREFINEECVRRDVKPTKLLVEALEKIGDKSLISKHLQENVVPNKKPARRQPFSHLHNPPKNNSEDDLLSRFRKSLKN